jgi:hypothetical protein
MTYFVAFSVAGLLAAGFGALAFRYARTLCLHLLIFWVYFVALPIATAWLYNGRLTSRALIGQDLYSDALAAELPAHAHLYVLYELGVLVVACAFSDAQLSAAIRRTLAAQRFSIVWPILAAAAVLIEAACKLKYGVFLSGSHTLERMLALPYVVSSLLQVLRILAFGLICYLAVLSARVPALFLFCLAYAPYILATDGRRSTLMVLIACLVLRGLSLGFKPNLRLAAIAGAALLFFVLVGPIFVEARAIANSLQSTGTPIVAALTEGASRALDSFIGGETELGQVADNIAERGNAGTFFLTVVSRGVELQFGAMTRASILWAIPSVFVVKPELQVETMIEILAGMRLVDDANSVPTTLYVDFGWLGVFLAGVVMAFILYLLAKLLSRGNQFGILEVLALGTFFSLSFSIESELPNVLAALRYLALVAPLSLLAHFLTSGLLTYQARRRGRYTWRSMPLRLGTAPLLPREG